MRALDPAFSNHIDSGSTTLATCWRLTRQDGMVLGFTDHDVSLRFDETDFVPAHGFDGSETTAKLGPQVDTADVVGILHADAITEDDILLGRYDGASVETFRVNWRDPEMRDLVSRTTIGEITREDGRFRAELRSAQQALNVPQGRLYQSLCDATLGDARCGVDLTNPAFHGEASVAGIRDRLLDPAAPPLAAGQVVLFRLNGLTFPKHCAIMVSPTRFIHAQEQLGVVEANLTDGWRRRLAGAFAFPEADPRR